MKQAWLVGLLAIGLALGVLAGLSLLRSVPEQPDEVCSLPVEELPGDLWQPPSLDQVSAELVNLSFRDFVDRSYRLYLKRLPLYATYHGLDALLGTRSNGLGSFDLEYLDETRQIESLILSQLEAYDRDSLAPEDQLTYDVCATYWMKKIEFHAFVGCDYLVTNVYSGSPDWTMYDVLTTYHPRQTLADIEDYLMRMSLIAPYLDELVVGLEDRASRGIIAPKPVLTKARNLLTGMAFEQLDRHPIFFNLAMMVVGNRTLSEDIKRLIFVDAAQLMQTAVIPAYQRLYQKIAELEEVASESMSLLSTPNGAAYYAHLIQIYGETDASPDQLLAQAQEVIDSVQTSIRQEAAALGYSDGDDFAALMTQLATDSGTYINDSIPEAFSFQLQDAIDLSRGVFHDLPSAGINVVVNPFIVAFYRPAGLQPGRVAELSVPRTGSQPKLLVPTQTYHETYPGMHVYFSYAQHADLSLFRQTALFGPHAQGWCTYAERLAWEQGAYEDDPFGNIGRLFEELKGAVLVATNLSMHLNDWTYDEAMGYYLTQTGDSEAHASMNVLQAAAHPGSFISYFTGFYKILELRAEAQSALGNRFNLPDFHEAILQHGSLPLDLLERAVQRYIAMQSAD